MKRLISQLSRKRPRGRSSALARLMIGAATLIVGLGSVALATASAHRTARPAVAAHSADTGSATGLGQLSGFLPASHLTLKSAINVNLSKETARLPIYPGTAPVPGHSGRTERVWYILEDASDPGAADDLGVNYAPKLANAGIGCSGCVQTVTEANPSVKNNPFGPAVIHFHGAPNFAPTRIAVPGPNGFPRTKLQPGAVATHGYSPFIRIKGSTTGYNAPIVATGARRRPGMPLLTL